MKTEATDPADSSSLMDDSISESINKKASDSASTPPTAPFTVVWSLGRPYVLEESVGRPRWIGTDRFGRPQVLTSDDLRRRGWSYRRAG